MRTKWMFLSGSILIAFLLLCGQAFAGTGGPSDGQIMVLAILALLSLILSVLYFPPLLFHWIKDMWKKYRHC
ncbi:MAG: hypothetical protein NTW10_14830 [Bacteroidetes bacterium]|nr:hypothetical protein [Bacteroidota bacterium]